MENHLDLNFANFLNQGSLISPNFTSVWLCSSWSQMSLSTESEKAIRSMFFYDPRFDFKFEKQMIVPELLKRLSLKDLQKQTKEHLSAGAPKAVNWQADYQHYKKDFESLMNKIEKGLLKKAVPFVEFKAPKPKNFNTEVLPYILNQVIEKSPNEHYLYGKWDHETGFIGSTPEILISGDRKNLSLMALAGTLNSQGPSMLEDPKLVDEHQWVVQDIDEKLAEHSLVWESTHEAFYGPIKHLRTWAELKSFQGSFLKLIKDLSPTSALGTYPKEALRLCQDSLHIHSRGTYGGAFGLLDKNTAHILVCLRGLFWDKNSLIIPVGGGIIEQSDYQNEVAELELKFESIKKKLGL